MPVTHGVTGSSPVRTAINIENQYFTPKNVKSGAFGLVIFISIHFNDQEMNKPNIIQPDFNTATPYLLKTIFNHYIKIHFLNSIIP